MQPAMSNMKSTRRSLLLQFSVFTFPGSHRETNIILLDEDVSRCAAIHAVDVMRQAKC